jgi:hypothetical protein
MAFFPTTISSLLYLQAVLLAVISAILFSVVRRRFGPFSAIVLCAGFLAVRPTQELASEIMSEPLLALLTLLATLAIARYFETGRFALLVWFGVVVELAIHTKGSGIALLAVPSLVAVCLRRGDEFRKPAFWLAHGAMLLVLTPWQLCTWKMVQNGMAGPVGFSLIAAQWRGFAAIVPAIFGWPLLAAIVCGGCLTIAGRRLRDPLVVSCAATAAATIVFHCVAPNGAEPRRLFMAIPGALVLAAVPVNLLLESRSRRGWVPAALLALVTLSLLPSPAPFRKGALGYRAVSSWLLGSVGRSEGAVLVASGIGGEGLLVSEIAQSQPDPRLYIVRSSKLFTDCDWLSRDCRPGITEPLRAQEVLDSIPVSRVVVDNFPGVSSEQLTDLVRSTIAARPDLWVLRKTVIATDPRTETRGEIRVYERTGLTRPLHVHVQVDLRRMIGRAIGD